VSTLEKHGVSFAGFLRICAELVDETIGPHRKALRERFVEVSLKPLEDCKASYIKMMMGPGGLPAEIAQHMWDLFGRDKAPRPKVFVDRVPEGQKLLEHIENIMLSMVNRVFPPEEDSETEEDSRV
jgi:hypothetical protein